MGTSAPKLHRVEERGCGGTRWVFTSCRCISSPKAQHRPVRGSTPSSKRPCTGDQAPRRVLAGAEPQARWRLADCQAPSGHVLGNCSPGPATPGRSGSELPALGSVLAGAGPARARLLACRCSSSATLRLATGGSGREGGREGASEGGRRRGGTSREGRRDSEGGSHGIRREGSEVGGGGQRLCDAGLAAGHGPAGRGRRAPRWRIRRRTRSAVQFPPPARRPSAATAGGSGAAPARSPPQQQPSCGVSADRSSPLTPPRP